MTDLWKPSLSFAILAFSLPIGIILYGTAFLKMPPILPLVMASLIACLFGKYLGYTWIELQEAMLDSISRVLPVMILLIEIGMLIGVWILSGTIPMTIYWGLSLISPSIFLGTAFILCVVASTMTGTSFGTMGTMGIALLGVGQSLGYPVPLIVGAIVSGSYFGDKMSPVSSSTYIASSICEVELFTHIRSMMWTTIPAAVLTAIIYSVMGMEYSATGISSDIPLILNTLEGNFNLSLWTMIPPLLLLVLAYGKYPAIPTVMLCIIVGGGVAWFLQQQSLQAISHSMVNGYTGQTGVKQLDALLSRGGINSITNTIMLLIAAVAFGGVLEKTRILAIIVEGVIEWAHNTGRLIFAVLIGGYIMLIGTGSQMVTIIIPGRAFAPIFKERGIQLRVLSRTVEDSGVIAAPLVPWSVHGFYILGILGVSAYDYAPYAIMCWLVPFFSIAFGYTGFAIWREESKISLNKNECNMGKM